MTTGIAMPSWSSGFIGLVLGNLEIFNETIEYVKNYCYVDDVDLVKVPKYKRTCVIRGIRRVLEKYLNDVRKILIHVDIYGIINKLCTEYRVSRLLIINKAYDYVIDILDSLKLIDGDVYVDSEFGNHISRDRHFKIYVSDEISIVKVARFIASLPEVSQCSIFNNYRRFILDTEDFIVEFYDIKDSLYSKILEDIHKIKST